MIFAIDRAGFVTGDGETHHGLLDVPFLNTIPGVTIFSPTYYSEMNNSFVKALYHEPSVVAVRIFKGSEPEMPDDYNPTFDDFEIYGDDNADIAVVTYGRLFASAAKAVKALKADGISAKVIKLNKIKPINHASVKIAAKCNNVFFYEEGEISGGVAEIFNRMLTEEGFNARYIIKAVNDEFVHHASAEILLEEYGMDENSMIKYIKEVVSGE